MVLFQYRIFKYFLLIPLSLFYVAVGSDYWQQKVDYKMNITLNDSIRLLNGVSSVSYKNNSPDTLNSIFFHLYPNAFQKGSVKYREYLQNYGSPSRQHFFKNGLKNNESKIIIKKIEVSNALNSENLDSYRINDTVLEIILKNSLKPFEELSLILDWEHHIGEQVERAGYVDGQYNMAQWYPKVAAYDEDGWHAGPFHAEGEFYGDFGDFDVTLNLPSKFIVGATGVVVSGDPGWSSVHVDTLLKFNEWLNMHDENYKINNSYQRSVQFFAKEVHDFAWIASPNFLYEHENYSGIDIHILYNRENAQEWTSQVAKRSVRAMDWLTNNFGEYPYPQITNTDRLKGGGMEYPMLVMDGSDSESLIVHEFGHNWFYAILANNETDEAWLDEGFTSVQTRDYMMHRYGEKGFNQEDIFWITPFEGRFHTFTNMQHKEQWNSIKFITSGRDEPISRSSHMFKNYTSYRQNAYKKPGHMLTELRYMLGDSVYKKIQRSYYKKWKLKHVNEARFIEIAETVSGKELSWFFNAWLHDTQILDYGINNWKRKKRKDGDWDVELVINNYGNRYMPLLIETELENGELDFAWWDNHLWMFSDTVSYKVKNKPKRITLDPDLQTLDVNFRNNTTKMKTDFIIDWPGQSYLPRDKYVYKFAPSLQYHSLLGYIPGIRVSRDYGYLSKQIISLNFPTDYSEDFNSNKLFWEYSSTVDFSYKFHNIKLKYWASDQAGLNEAGIEFTKKWYKVYKRKPEHQIKYGFYFQTDVDTNYTNLYEYGDLGVSYIKYNYKNEKFNLNTVFSSSINVLSKWEFLKFSNIMTGFIKANDLYDVINESANTGIRYRLFTGKLWSSNDYLPKQVEFSISGAESKSANKKHYLRDHSSFYGYENIYNKYHKPGEGNIRGLLNNKIFSDEIVSVSLEPYYQTQMEGLDFLSLDLYVFCDFAYTREVNTTKTYSNYGLGFKTNKRILGKEIFLRIDIPLQIYIDSKILDDGKSIIFSFEKAI